MYCRSVATLLLSQLSSDVTSMQSLQLVQSFLAQLASLNKPVLSMNDFLSGNAHIQQLFNMTVTHAPNLLQSILWATLQAPADQLYQLTRASDPIGYLCNMSSNQLATFWGISNGSQVDLMRQLLCSMNASSVSSDFAQLVGLHGILGIPASSVNATTLQKVLDSYVSFLINLQQVDTTQFLWPNISVEQLEHILNNFLHNVSQSDIQQIEVLLNRVIASLANIPGVGGNISMAYQLYMALANYVTSVSNSLVSGQTFNVMSLFNNVSVVQSLFATSLNLSSDLVPLLSQVSVNIPAVSNAFICIYSLMC